MNKVALVSSDAGLVSRVTSLIPPTFHPGATLTTAEDAIEYLDLEVPDLVFINFSDPRIDSFALLDAVLKDPWLHHGSIIGLCADHDVGARLEEARSANLVVSLIDDEAESYLPKILDILGNNRRILYQRRIGADLVHSISGAFQLQNEALEASCYANLVCNFLYNANKIDAAGKMAVHLALTEMFLNAIEHGNCGITYEEKSAWLEEGNMMRDLIAERCKQASVAARRVFFEYTIGPERSTFIITDEGTGFDWRRLKDAAGADAIGRLHGRGIKMTRKYTQNLRFNEKGNEVRFEIEHIPGCHNATPAVFEQIEPTLVRAGDVVFEQGERGDFLYYLAKGEFDVLFNGVKVSTLSPDDIVMGELSFLLNNRRTATVRATTDGMIIRMSKKDFVEALKQKPHYGLFLARLLAQRIQRLNVEHTGS